MPDSASLSDLARVLIPTLIGAAIGLLGPILYARFARRRGRARPLAGDAGHDQSHPGA
jgi:hypothetical protein